MYDIGDIIANKIKTFSKTISIDSTPKKLIRKRHIDVTKIEGNKISIIVFNISLIELNK